MIVGLVHCSAAEQLLTRTVCRWSHKVMTQVDGDNKYYADVPNPLTYTNDDVFMLSEKR